jgi:hypothetical protein
MKNKQIIDRTKEIAVAMLNGRNLDQALWDFNLQTSQGAWNAAYLIGKGKFTQDALDFMEANEDVLEDLYFLYDEALYNAAEELPTKPVEYGFTQEEVDNMSEDEIFDHIQDGWADFVYPAFYNFIAICIQTALDEIN